jgi:thioredoxin-related protein
MYRVTLVLILLLISPLLSFNILNNSNTDNKEIEWLTLEEAYERNLTEPRKIFVDVYTDWCGWCKKMDKDTFQDEKVAAYVNENYYAVKLNAESNKQHSLGGAMVSERQVARQWKVSGYPTVVFLEEDFRTIMPVGGYKKPNEFLKILEGFRNSSSN